MKVDDFVCGLKKLKIKEGKPENPELFSLHQRIAYKIEKSSYKERANNHSKRMVCDNLIEPIP